MLLTWNIRDVIESADFRAIILYQYTYSLIDLYSALELCATLQERHYQSEAQELGTR